MHGIDASGREEDRAAVTETLTLLSQWHGGDEAALKRLLEANLGWIRGRVRKRLGAKLRGKMDSMDMVQDAMVDVLRNGPNFLIADQGQFRAFMARVVENVIRDQDAWFRAKRRELAREKPLPGGSVLPLDAGARSITRPSQAAERDEVQSWIRLGLELLDPDDRRIVVLRQWENRSFAEIAEAFDTTEDAARMRFNRALARLASKLKELKSGESFLQG